MKILIVCKNPLYPIQDGAQRRTADLVEYLNNFYCVDIISFNKGRGRCLDDVSFRSDYNKYFVVNRKENKVISFCNRIIRSFSYLSTFSEYSSLDLKSEIASIEKNYDWLIFQGYDCLDIIDESICKKKIIIDLLVAPLQQLEDANRISFSWWSAIVKGTFFPKNIKLYLSHLYLLSDVFIFLTEKDKNLTMDRREISFNKGVVAGIPIKEITGNCKKLDKSIDFIFCGIDNEINRTSLIGVSEYIKKISSSINVPLTLGVYGDIFEYIKNKILFDVNVEVVCLNNYTIEKAHELSKISLCVNASGTGIKTKVLNAIKSNCIPIVSEVSNQGVGISNVEGVVAESYGSVINESCVLLVDECCLEKKIQALKLFSNTYLTEEKIYFDLKNKINQRA